MRGCDVEGCDQPHRGRGYCNAHLLRFQRHGDPLAGGTGMGETERVLLKLVQIETDDCVIWPLGKISAGYGLARVNGQMWRVHRFALVHRGEPQPSPRHEANHICNMRACLNYRHLRWGTRADNERDKIAAGTDNAGERNGMARLTADDVAAIRSATGSQRSIGERYGISQQHVSVIRRGGAWRRV